MLLCQSSTRRTALFHTSATLGASFKRGDKPRGPPKPEFKRDEVPHSGRAPAQDRTPRRSPTEPIRSYNGRSQSSRGRGGGASSHRRDSDRRVPNDSSRYPVREPNDRRIRPPLPSNSLPSDRARPPSIETLYKTSKDRSPILDPRRQPRNPLLPSSSALSLSSHTPPEPAPTNTSVENSHIEYENPEHADEFFHPLEPVSTASTTSKSASKNHDTASGFSSPPLLPGFVSALKELLGPSATPTPIQSLSIAHCVPPVSASGAPVPGAPPGWKQFLLASETGSGKSIAYLLPLLQGVKAAELADKTNPPPPLSDAEVRKLRLYNPRGLVLAPTHELARQLAGMAKALLHDVKLRVVCASRANGASSVADPARLRVGGSAAKMAERVAGLAMGADGAVDVKRGTHPVGVLVGTPMKLLEMVRGRGWDRAEQEAKNGGERGVYEELKVRRGRDKVVHFGTWRAKPELGLANVEWVVVDEADVLFDPDFQETTRTLLADISAARGHVLPAAASEPVPAPLAQAPSTRLLSSPILPTTPTPATTTSAVAATPIDYPFHLLLTSATIPKALAAYLATYHPALVRLASPRLHKLPRALQTEYVGWTGGRKEADVMRRLRRVWAEDAAGANATSGVNGPLSQVLVFCNRSARVVELAAHLEREGVRCVALTSKSEQRARGSNRHLAAFLRARPSPSPSPSSATSSSTSSTSSPRSNTPGDPKTHPHVLITTSLLSRGLDFAPSIRHVFIVDEPRNTVDFLHRAGRTGRAGAWGKVVVFGKMKGRGAERGREVRRRVGALTR